jgi:cation transport ATPase
VIVVYTVRLEQFLVHQFKRIKVAEIQVVVKNMQKTTFEISKMDCPSEENLIRMKLDEILSVKNLDFDIANRKLFVFHIGDIDQIEKSIIELKLGAKKIITEESEQTHFKENTNQRKLLWTVLTINFVFFLIEMTTGLISKSLGLVADSLDMLADSFVYGISLFAVGGTLIKKKQIAKLAGYFQIIPAIIGFIEVIRRFLGTEKLPNFSTMIVVSILALIANGICLYLMQKSKSKGEAHMKASLIFTSNDIIINLGVILAGVLVNWLHSNKPDLIIGTVVFILVVQGAIRILKLSK